ncbi:putative DNA-directed DNA polymerase [Actinomyces urogenitalis DSM 15434]|jgi:DNA polymerase|uniref:DNA-directed DNA polymerase n=1 Tax=Actinomyces urogenitalis DSM 15434 TaxID=525246 RepID=C0W4D9_9ACTO|nr:putative DNA-directed DNA polymerase [Actinomyces urogenitalis DSM 15434]
MKTLKWSVMRTLSIDIETFSKASLPSVGVYRYAADESFEILLFAYAVDGGEVQIVDLARGEQIPGDVLDALEDPGVVKSAFNAAFERVCLSAHLGHRLDPEGWRCSMVWASFAGVPLDLAGVAKALHLETEKMGEGKNLIRYFSLPAKPTKANGGRERNLPEHAPDDWETFKAYCKRDVEVELAITKRLHAMPMPAREWDNYWDDQRINDRGVRIDADLATAAVDADNTGRASALERMRELTRVDNPASVTQLLAWLRSQGLQIDSLAKADVAAALEGALEGDVAEVLALRQEMAKSSVKKYERMLACRCPDGRAHGLLQFMGAGRTGRWAGRLVQVQNLPRQSISDLEAAADLVRTGHADMLETLWGSAPQVLSELIRAAFVAEPGSRFLVADYSAIEARTIAWLAGEQWVLDLFEAGGDIYCETGTRMFRQVVEKHSPLRQRAKVAVLACGYQGGVGALKTMGGEKLGLSEDEMADIVAAWRAANPKIAQLWWDINAAAIAVIKDGGARAVGRIRLAHDKGALIITLPSGRPLVYPSPRIGENRFGGESITHMGVGVNRKWGRIETYGGKLTENIVQATARDILAHAIARLERSGYPVVMHIHDEVVTEVPEGRGSVEELCALMSQAPPWADGLPLAAEGFESTYYRKG